MSNKGDKNMGTILHQNSNEASNDSWALVSGGTVQSMITANLAFVISIQGSYDYLVDVSVSAQTANPGWIYDSGLDTFSAPPIDWISVVRNDFDNIIAVLAVCLSDSVNLSPEDLLTAYNDSISDSSASFTTNEADLLTAIYNYIAGGG